MVSFESNYEKVLNLLAEAVRRRVLPVLSKKNDLPVDGFKALLDAQAQEAILEALEGLKEPFRLVSEEGEAGTGGGYTLVADPVDGTTNLARGLTPAATSLSLSKSGHQSGVLAGIVMDLYTGETFYAERGRGATRDGEPMRTAGPVDYEHALLSIDISKAPRLEKVGRLLENGRHIRAEGCAAMGLCRVASGVLDAHIDVRGMVRATDISAGLLILREAGGIYTLNGEVFGDMPLERDSRAELVASGSRELLEEINDLLEKR